MSCEKKDQIFPTQKRKSGERKLALIVAAALRQDFGNEPHAVKRLSILTDKNPRTVKNWYEARNAPPARELLQIARASPTLRAFVLQAVGAWRKLRPRRHAAGGVRAGFDKAVTSKTAISAAEPLHNKLHNKSRANPRQDWFLENLGNGNRINAVDLAERWRVSLRTARTDIAALKAKKLIQFVGARKTGCYTLAKEADCRAASMFTGSDS